MGRVAADGGERIGGFDRTILATQRVGRNVAADCGWLVEFDGEPPTLERLRAHVQERAGALPWLSKRLAHPALRLGAPRMVPDSEYDIARHVLRVERSFDSQLRWLDFVGEQLGRSLAEPLPQWSLHLAHGEEGFALFLRHHHFVADGQSGFLMLRTLLAGAPAAAPSPARSAPSPLALTLAGIGERIGGSRRSAAPLVGRRAGGGEARAFATALVKWLAGPRPPRVNALNGPLGTVRRAASMALPAQELRLLSRRTGCFPNEIYLALLAGGLRRYLAGQGVAVARLANLQVGTLVDVGGRREPPHLGNRYAAVRISLNVSEPDVERRVQAIRSARRSLHESADIDGSLAMVNRMACMPAPLVWVGAWILTSPRASLNTIASHMAGARGVSFQGERPRRLRSWTYLPAGHSLSFVCQLAPAEMTVNILADASAVADLDGLVSALEESRAELLEAFGERPAAAAKLARSA